MKKFQLNEFKILTGANAKYFSLELIEKLMQQQNEMIDFLSDTHPKQFQQWHKELEESNKLTKK